MARVAETEWWWTWPTETYPCQPRPAVTGISDDVATVRSEIETADPGCIVVAHSYGGSVLSEAASGLPNVGRLIYLAAFMTEPGQGQLEILAASGSELLKGLLIHDGYVSVNPEMAQSIFFTDSDDRTARQAVSQLRPMTITGGELDHSLAPAWKTAPSTYVVCAQDRALPTPLEASDIEEVRPSQARGLAGRRSAGGESVGSAPASAIYNISFC
jgi:pimeloyl-ACP methyl ester carboxylesterase